MNALFALSILLLLLGGTVWAARRHLTLFVVTAEGGRITKLSGRLPPGLRSDLEDVIARSQTKRLRIECRFERGRAVVAFNRDSDPGLQQIVRNLVCNYPAIRLVQARRARAR